MIHVPPSAFGSSSHLHLAGWQGGRDRTGCPPRQDNRTGRGKEKRGEYSRVEGRGAQRNINGSVYPVSVLPGGRDMGPLP